MKRLITGIFILLTLSPAALSQKQYDWEKYISNDPSGQRVSEADYLIIEVEKSVKTSAIRSSGIEWIRRFAEGVYLISAKSNLSQVQFLKNHWPANNLWKLVGGKSIEETGKENSVFIQTISNDITLLTDKYPIETIDIKRHLYKVSSPTQAMLVELMESPLILAISAEGTSPAVESRVIDMNLNPNYVNKVRAYYPELTGSTQVVSIQEQRFDETDLDLVGRSVPSDLAAEGQSNHATEMATIIAGAGNSFITGRGVAPRAKITSSDFSDALPDAPGDYQGLGIYTQNHSYGTQEESFYGIQARAFDQSCYENPYLLHVFSSGNAGNTVSSSGTYAGIAGYANLTGNFKMAKNLLVIGAVDTTYRRVNLSSRGPAYDGRVKPELVGYSMAGSSNSAALASGVSALLQEKYFEQEETRIPSALLKAFLINTARDAGSEGPDHITGFGSVDAYRALTNMENGYYFSDTVSQGEASAFQINIPPASRDLKVTLCWTDPPGEIDNFKALVNDLDLKLVTPETDTLNPWVLSVDPDSTALAQPATRGEDHLNNVEQISYTLAEPGVYTLIVNGYDIPLAKQPFYITYSWRFDDQFEWDYPTGADNMPYNGETDTYFRWTSTYSSQEGLLRYKTAGADDWVVLENSVPVSRGFWRWENIPNLQSPAVAQMLFGGQTFTTDTFTISRPPETSIGFNCGDSLLLQWEPVAGAGRYEVSHLDNGLMTPLYATEDTFLILAKSALVDPYLAVQAFSANDKPLIEGYTFDYNFQGSGCFLISFFQEVVPDEGIYLNLNLTTSYGIESVAFERLAGDSPGLVAHVDLPNTNRIRVLDDAPNQGYNEHRVLINLKNGQQITATASNTYYLTEKALLVFPNPLFRSDFLNIYTKELESSQPVFRLFDQKGGEVLRYTLFTRQESVELDKLRGGLYFYRLEDTNKTYTGKLIIR